MVECVLKFFLTSDTSNEGSGSHIHLCVRYKEILISKTNIGIKNSYFNCNKIVCIKSKHIAL